MRTVDYFRTDYLRELVKIKTGLAGSELCGGFRKSERHPSFGIRDEVTSGGF